MYTDIADSVYLLDVLVVVVHISHRNCWEYLLLHQDWGECSEGWAGAWCVGMGGGGGWKFLVTEFFSRKSFVPYYIFFSKNVPGVLKRMQTIFFFGGGEKCWGVWGGLNTPVESSRVTSNRVESSFPTLKSKGAKLHLLGLFGLSVYWYLQTVLQRSIYLEITSRAILHNKLGDVKNFLVYIIASYCEVVLWLIT